jgi:hypothetical protein
MRDCETGGGDDAGEDGVDACRAECRSAHGDGFSEGAGATLSSCEAARCSAECGLSCGGYTYPSGVCASCAEQRCCAPATDCALDAECAAYVFCARACSGDSACLGDCNSRHPSGIALAQPFGTCTSTACGAVCGSHSWDCVGSVQWPPPGGATTLRLVVTDFLKGTPLVGLTATACNRVDADCTLSPIATKATNLDGVVEFDFASTFDGYVQVTGAAIQQALLFLPHPITGDFTQSWSILSGDEYTQLAPLIGHTLDPARGHVIVQTRDCLGATPAGLTLRAAPSDQATVVFYVAQGLPDKAAMHTDGSGVGGIANLLPGFVTVEALIAPIDLVTSERTVVVRKGWLTYHPAWPTPPVQ